jgi:flagellar motor switch protein FliN/FliY
MTSQDLCTRFTAELTRALGAMFEANASSRPAEPPAEDGYAVSIASAGAERGLLTLFFGRRGADALAARLAAAEGSSPSAPLEMLGALSAQAAAAVVDKTPSGAPLQVVAVEPADAPGAAPVAAVDLVMAGHEEVLHVAFAGNLVYEDGRSRLRQDRSRTLDVILDIDLSMVVRFGRTKMPLKALTALAPGSLVDLGRTPDEPVEVLISNRVVARGEVVIVGGNYGVRIRDVISPAERARSLEVELA